MTRFLRHNTSEISLRIDIMFYERHDLLSRGRFFGRIDGVVDLNAFNINIYAVKVFILHENRVLFAIYNY